MLALVAVILAVLAAFNVAVGNVGLGWLAVAFLAAHVLLRDRVFDYGLVAGRG